jgi:hypothetical protein
VTRPCEYNAGFLGSVNVGDFLARLETITFSRRALLHGDVWQENESSKSFVPRAVLL